MRSITEIYDVIHWHYIPRIFVREASLLPFNTKIATYNYKYKETTYDDTCGICFKNYTIITRVPIYLSAESWRICYKCKRHLCELAEMIQRSGIKVGTYRFSKCVIILDNVVCRLYESVKLFHSRLPTELTIYRWQFLSLWWPVFENLRRQLCDDIVRAILAIMMQN